MPYVLQGMEDQESEAVEVLNPAQLPPQAVAAAGAANVTAAILRALGAQRQAEAPCKPCEKKKRLQRLMALRQQGR